LTSADDIAIEQALQNARTNSEITTYKAVQRDAIKDTLSRFASGPRKLQAGGPVSSSTSRPQRQTLDVDAFKRLLLTGDRAASSQNAGNISSNVISDSSSSTDTASISQRSILETTSQAVDETPRSSIEVEAVGAENEKPTVQEGKRKPPPPKPRYGKPINEHPTAVAAEPEPSPEVLQAPEFVAALQTPTPVERANPMSGPEGGLDSSEVKKRPPTPPLTRRKSQNKTGTRPNLTRNPSSKQSVDSISSEPLSPAGATPGKMPPPPPPMRRANSHASRKTSSDLPATLEEGEDDDGGDAVSISSKRISLGPPPPVPPPRRNRGSSRSSMDSQRPSFAQGGSTGSRRSSIEYSRPSHAGSESRNVSGASTSTNTAADIMADLAALQREVDAARGQVAK
jgi:hypothetical protein